MTIAGYTIERRTRGKAGSGWMRWRNIWGGWVEIGRTHDTSFVDEKFSVKKGFRNWLNRVYRPGAIYEYRVRAFNEFGRAGYWAYSAEVPPETLAVRNRAREEHPTETDTGGETDNPPGEGGEPNIGTGFDEELAQIDRAVQELSDQISEVEESNGRLSDIDGIPERRIDLRPDAAKLTQLSNVKASLSRVTAEVARPTSLINALFSAGNYHDISNAAHSSLGSHIGLLRDIILRLETLAVFEAAYVGTEERPGSGEAIDAQFMHVYDLSNRFIASDTLDHFTKKGVRAFKKDTNADIAEWTKQVRALQRSRKKLEKLPVSDAGSEQVTLRVNFFVYNPIGGDRTAKKADHYVAAHGIPLDGELTLIKTETYMADDKRLAQPRGFTEGSMEFAMPREDLRGKKLHVAFPAWLIAGANEGARPAQDDEFFKDPADSFIRAIALSKDETAITYNIYLKPRDRMPGTFDLLVAFIDEAGQPTRTRGTYEFTLKDSRLYQGTLDGDSMRAQGLPLEEYEGALLKFVLANNVFSVVVGSIREDFRPFAFEPEKQISGNILVHRLAPRALAKQYSTTYALRVKLQTGVKADLVQEPDIKEEEADEKETEKVAEDAKKIAKDLKKGKVKPKDSAKYQPREIGKDAFEFVKDAKELQKRLSRKLKRKDASEESTHDELLRKEFADATNDCFKRIEAYQKGDDSITEQDFAKAIVELTVHLLDRADFLISARAEQERLSLLHATEAEAKMWAAQDKDAMRKMRKEKKKQERQIEKIRDEGKEFEDLVRKLRETQSAVVKAFGEWTTSLDWSDVNRMPQHKSVLAKIKEHLRNMNEWLKKPSRPIRIYKEKKGTQDPGDYEIPADDVGDHESTSGTQEHSPYDGHPAEEDPNNTEGPIKPKIR